MGGKSTTSTQQVTIPPEVLARYNSVNANAQSAASTPFKQYSTDPNAFVQPMTDTQNAGVANTNASATTAQPYFGAATNTLNNAQSGAQPYNAAATGLIAGSAGAVNPTDLNSGAINKYLSPYLSTVLGSEASLLNQQNQTEQSGQLGNAIKSGAFGGDRSGIAAANLSQQQSLANSNIFSNILNQGYGQALGAAQQQQGVDLSAGQANRSALGAAGQAIAGLGQQVYGQGANTAQELASLGTGAQTAGIQGAQAQLAAGQVQQQTGQAGLTALYNQFLQQQSYPFQTAQFLANIAEGTGVASGNTQTTTQPGGFFSDARLKEHIEEIGRTHDGQPIYKYNYKHGDKRKQLGLLAHEVERQHPDAVGLHGGFKTVDYDKATEGAERHHRYSGGLVPAHAGGHVSMEHMGEGFAGGGSPMTPGLAGVDMNALLESQAKMYGPYASAGTYGGSPTGAPHGGAKGYVPEANLPVSHLATAGALPPQQNPMQQVKDATELAKTGMGIYAGGKKEGWWGGDAKKPDTSLSGTTYNNDSLNIDNSNLDQLALDATKSARGGLIVPHMAGGGMPYSGEENGKLDIPDTTPSAHLQTASGSPGQSSSGLNDVAQLAKMGMMIFGMNRGGRAGLAVGGDPEVDTIATPDTGGGGDTRSNFEQVDDPSRPGAVTSWLGTLLKPDAPKKSAVDQYPEEDMLAKPAAPAKKTAPHPVAAPPPAAAMPAAVPAAGLAPSSVPNDYGPPQSPDYTSGPHHPAPPTGLAPPAATTSGASPVVQPGGNDQPSPSAPRKFMNWLKDNQDWVLPAAKGIATMGVTPTRSLGVALASGLNAAAGSVLPTQQAQAELEQTKAQTGQIGANTQNIMASTGLTRQEAAGIAMQNVGKANFKIGSIDWVTLNNGAMMPAYKWQGMKNPPPLLGMSQALAAVNNPETDIAKVGKSTGMTATPATAQAGPFSASPAAMQAIEADATSNAAGGASGLARAQSRTNDVRKEIGDNAEAAQAQGRQLTNLGVAISTLPEDGALSGSAMDTFLTPAMASWNWAMKLAGAPPSAMFDTNNLDQKIIAGKLAAGMQFAQASSAGQHAYAALQTAAEAIPGKGIPRSTSIDLTANMMIDKQRALDMQHFEQDAYNKASNKAAYNADVARTQFRQQNSDERYAQERQQLIQLMSARDNQGRSLVSELMKGTYSAKAVEKALGAPGITRYLYNM